MITWTPEMIETLEAEFPTAYNRVLAKKLEVSMRTLIRKARELNIEKEPDFLEKRRDEITQMAVKAHPPHPMKGVQGWAVSNSEKTRFKIGNESPMKDPAIVKKVTESRNKTIRRERIRITYGMRRLTKLNLK